MQCTTTDDLAGELSAVVWSGGLVAHHATLTQPGPVDVCLYLYRSIFNGHYLRCGQEDGVSGLLRLHECRMVCVADHKRLYSDRLI